MRLKRVNVQSAFDSIDYKHQKPLAMEMNDIEKVFFPLMESHSRTFPSSTEATPMVPAAF